MFIYITYDIENDSDMVEAVSVRNDLIEAGHQVIFCGNLPDDALDRRLEYLRRCDALYMVTEKGRMNDGLYEEIDFCKDREMPIFYHEECKGKVALSLTEQRCPRQVINFMDIIMKMYRIHIKKNADYSPANILGTGSIGVVVRMWDKMARIMNLVGFDIKIVTPATVSTKLEAQNEPLEDSFWDIAVYAIIKILLDKGVWGR